MPFIQHHYGVIPNGITDDMTNASKIQHLTNAKARYMQLKDPLPSVVKAYDNEIANLEKQNDLPPKRQQEPQLQAIPESNPENQSR